MYASWNGYTDIAKLLIDANALIEVEDFTGYTALIYASEHNKIDKMASSLKHASNWQNYKNKDCKLRWQQHKILLNMCATK